MNNKTITLVVNEEDVRKLTANAVAHVIARFGESYQKRIGNLNLKIQAEKSSDILRGIEEILDLFDKTSEELQGLTPLIQEVDPVPAPEPKE